MEIFKGSAQFQYGISDASQLQAFLQQHPQLVGLAFVGRSNVGKSTLINKLFGKKTARTSKAPGRTREVNIFTFSLSHQGRPFPLSSPLFLFDLPGYGFANVSQKVREQWDALMATFFQFLPPAVGIINLQDARHPNSQMDREFHQFFRPLNLSIFLVFNKMDKLRKQSERSNLAKQQGALADEYPRAQKILFVSAKDQAQLPLLESALTGHLLGQLELSESK